MAEPAMPTIAGSDLNLAEVEIMDKNKTPLKYSNFDVFELKNNKKTIISSYPLQRLYNKVLFLGNGRFTIYNPNYYEDYLEEMNNERSEHQSYEDWLKNEFGDDADTAYWNNY